MDGRRSRSGVVRRTDSGLTQAQRADLETIAAYGRALTRRQIEVLTKMRDADDSDAGSDDGELVRECCDAFLGDDRVASRTVDALLRACAIRNDGDQGGVERYRINDTGREILAARAKRATRPAGAKENDDGA